MSDYSASFLYEAIDKVTPVLDKINKAQKKLGVSMVKQNYKIMDSSKRAHDKIQKHLEKTGKSHKKLADKARESANKQVSSNNKIVASSRKMADMGKAGMTKIGVPFIAGTTAMILAGGKFEDSMASLQAVTGMSDDTLSSISKQILKVGVSYNTGASQVADGMKLIGSKKPELLETPAMLLKVAESSLTLSKASGMAFVESSSALTNVMNQYGLAGDQALRVTNLLASAEQKGSVNVLRISEAMIQAGTASKEAGISLEQTLGVMDVLGKAGIEGARAGTAIRSIFSKMSLGAKEFNPLAVGTAQALENISKMSKTERQKKFGEEYSNIAKIMAEGRKRTMSFSVAIQGNQTAIENAKINMATFNEQIKKAYVIVQNKLILAFNDLKPILSKALDVFISIAKWVGRFIENNKLLVKILFVATGAVVALSTALFVIGSTVTGIVSAKLAIALLGKTSLISALSATKLGFALKGVGIIGAVVGAGLAGWTFGKMLYEIPIIKKYLDWIYTKAFQILNIGGAGDEIERGHALDAERERLIAKRDESRRRKANEVAQSQKSLSSKIDFNAHVTSDNNTSIKSQTKIKDAGNLGSTKVGG